jgi:hypothetical protein
MVYPGVYPGAPTRGHYWVAPETGLLAEARGVMNVMHVVLVVILVQHVHTHGCMRCAVTVLYALCGYYCGQNNQHSVAA